MTDSLLNTPLHSWHVEQGGRMVDFAGWSMPVQYSSIVSEHRATRGGIGLFDISHMGRLEFAGPDAGPFLDRLLTRRVVGLQEGMVRYSLVVNEAGGILDDVLVYRVGESAGRPTFLLVVNASNRAKIVAWIERHRRADDDVQVEDRTAATAMIAVQGPQAVELMASLVEPPVSSMKYYSAAVATIGGASGLVSRTGYTGEDGGELIVPADTARQIWERLVDEGAARGLQPAGLGARDTLRLEAGMPLYGHELSEEIDPYQAGLGFAVQTKDRQFIGRDALAAMCDAQDRPRRVGLEIEGRRVAREGYEVLASGVTVGKVTSGTFSPTLERPIAMAYVRSDVAEIGTELTVAVRGQAVPARVVTLPFYQRPK